MSTHHTLQRPPRMVGFVWNMLARVCEGHHDTALHWHYSVHLDIMHVATLEIIVCFHTLETGCNCTNHCCHLHGCEKLLTWWCIVDAMWQKSSLKQKIQAVVVIHLSKPISHFILLWTYLHSSLCWESLHATDSSNWIVHVETDRSDWWSLY